MSSEITTCCLQDCLQLHTNSQITLEWVGEWLGQDKDALQRLSEPCDKGRQTNCASHADGAKLAPPHIRISSLSMSCSQIATRNDPAINISQRDGYRLGFKNAKLERDFLKHFFDIR